MNYHDRFKTKIRLGKRNTSSASTLGPLKGFGFKVSYVMQILNCIQKKMEQETMIDQHEVQAHN